MTLSEPFILCDNLVKIYKVAGLEVVALQGLDLAVAKGELVGIVGASGSGKSTLMNILGGLDRPSAGRLWVNGRSLLDLSDAELTRYRRNQIGFVWQQGARNLIPFLTAVENIELPMTLAGVTGRALHQRAGALLEAVGLANRRNHAMSQLSGGEQQRVAIAVALANQPSILLADEPTGELDTATAQLVYDAFKELNVQFGVTTLIVSHDAGIARHVQRVVAIRDGKTSSETVRLAGDGEHAKEQFMELTVLDSAGRLQVPKEYLERYHLKGRVRLEAVQEGILIRPAPVSSMDHTVRRIIEQDSTAPKKKRRGWGRRSRSGD